MTLTLLKSKLHRLRVTEAELYYEGSISIDEELLRTAGILAYEKVQVVNVNNGARLETYTIPAPAGERTVCLNGPAARLAAVGDEIIVIAYSQMTAEEASSHRPRIVIVDDRNEPIDVLEMPAVPGVPSETVPA